MPMFSMRAALSCSSRDCNKKAKTMLVNNKYRKWRRKRISFQRRLLEHLVIILWTKEMVVVYLCIFYVLVAFSKPIIGFSTMYIFQYEYSDIYSFFSCKLTYSKSNWSGQKLLSITLKKHLYHFLLSLKSPQILSRHFIL